MSKEIFEALAAPFDPARVSWRIGSLTKDKSKGRALAYLDARDVMGRLDDVCGPNNWQNRYPHALAKTVCEIGLKLDGEWIWKSNGAGDSDIEAEKGALSDAFKRAAVLWGVGRYLYDIDSPWVKVNEWRQIDNSELPRLQALLPGYTPPKSARQGRADGDYKRLEEAIRECGTVAELSTLWSNEKVAINALPPGWKKSITEEKDRMKGVLTAENADAA